MKHIVENLLSLHCRQIIRQIREHIIIDPGADEADERRNQQEQRCQQYGFRMRRFPQRQFTHGFASFAE